MNLTSILLIILGILVIPAAIIFLKKRKKKDRIELIGIKGRLEEADKNLRLAHEQLDSLYKIFLEIEDKQEEILK